MTKLPAPAVAASDLDLALTVADDVRFRQIHGLACFCLGAYLGVMGVGFAVSIFGYARQVALVVLATPIVLSFFALLMAYKGKKTAAARLAKFSLLERAYIRRILTAIQAMEE